MLWPGKLSMTNKKSHQIEIMKKILICLALLALTGFGCTKKPTNVDEQNLKALPSAKDAAAEEINQPLTIFVGKDCPHCELIESRVKNTGMDRQLSIVFKESYENEQNAAELIQVAKQCNRPIDKAGVPLLWTGKTCYFGDANILRYLDERMKAFANEPK